MPVASRPKQRVLRYINGLEMITMIVIAMVATIVVPILTVIVRVFMILLITEVRHVYYSLRLITKYRLALVAKKNTFN